MPRACQRGFAFMMVLLGLVLGSLTFYVENLNQSVSTARQADQTRDALAQAKEILIAWAAESELNHNGPGHLPCPDNDNDGYGEGNSCGAPSRLGRFPWKTLNAPDLRDAGGERLWYAVSPNFLNKTTNPVNSDTRGMFRLTGATEQEGVIAIIFAPGPPISGQDRSTDVARKDRANYLEDPNLDDDEFKSEFGSAESNDRMAIITATDLYAAVDRKVAERVQTNVVPVLHHYVTEWAAANIAAKAEAAADGITLPIEPADKLLPYAAPFDPSAADACGQANLSQGLLPLGWCGQWQKDDVIWRKQSGTCNVVEDKDLPLGSMSALRCSVTISVPSDDDECDDDGDDEEESSFVTRRIVFDVVLAGAGRRTLAMPLDESRVIQEHSDQVIKDPSNVYSARLNGGDIAFRFDGKYRVNSCASVDERKVKIMLPVYRFDNQYEYTRFAAIDADSTLSEAERDRRKDQITPAWYFRNQWHRLTYYAGSSTTMPCTGCPTSLSVHDAEAMSAHGTLLVLAGQARDYEDALSAKHSQTRPTNSLADYFELKNGDDESHVFQRIDLTRRINDHVVSVCPWTPNPYRPEETQACP